MKVKYYKTDWEDDKNDDRRCRFEMLSRLLDEDVKNLPGLRPRILHLQDGYFHNGIWTTAIVVWE